MFSVPRLFLALMTTLFALGTAVAATVVNPCYDDAQKFCANVKGGPKAISKCLKDHETDLSDACKANRKELRHMAQEKMEKIDASCKKDAETVCKGVPAKKGRLWTCLKSNKAALSEACKAAIERDIEKLD